MGYFETKLNTLKVLLWSIDYIQTEQGSRNRFQLTGAVLKISFKREY